MAWVELQCELPKGHEGEHSSHFHEFLYQWEQ